MAGAIGLFAPVSAMLVKVYAQTMLTLKRDVAATVRVPRDVPIVGSVVIRRPVVCVEVADIVEIDATAAGIGHTASSNELAVAAPAVD